MESWLVVRCPKCQKENWIYNGDPSDRTFFESEGVKCWNCGCCWKISSDDDEAEEDEDTEEDDPRYELGQDFQEVKHEEKESNDEE